MKLLYKCLSIIFLERFINYVFLKLPFILNVCENMSNAILEKDFNLDNLGLNSVYTLLEWLFDKFFVLFK